MRQILLLSLCILEFVIALTLVRFGWLLPPLGEVEKSFAQVNEVTNQARKEIHQVRDQVKLLRKPELQKGAIQLQEQLGVVTQTLHDQKVDFETVAALRDGFSGVAEGLELFSKTLKPVHLEDLGEGLGITANFLDKKLLPAASEAAQRLDKSMALLQKDAKLTADFFQEISLDLEAVKEIHDGLAQFSKGLDKTKTSLEIKRLKTMKEGFEGMASALENGAEQVERLSSYTYPVISFNGLKPEIDRKQFWPEGEKIATGLRKASKGVQAANQEMEGMLKQLPEVRDSLEASQKVIDSTRKVLDHALQQRGKVEPVLKSLPKQAMQVAEYLPKLTQDLSKVFKETHKFKEVAAALRQAQNELRNTSKNWPQLQKTILGSAHLLKATQKQLEKALLHQKEYEKALEQSVNLADGFAAMLPLMSQQMLVQLEEQEQSLNDLGDSLGEVGNVMVSHGKIADSLVDTGRWLVWLIAIVVSLHGCYLLAGLRGKPAQVG